MSAFVLTPEGGKTIAYPLDTLIQDAERWADFWNDLHPGKPVPAIDFERRMVIATVLGGGTATSAIPSMMSSTTSMYRFAARPSADALFLMVRGK